MLSQSCFKNVLMLFKVISKLSQSCFKVVSKLFKVVSKLCVTACQQAALQSEMTAQQTEVVAVQKEVAAVDDHLVQVTLPSLQPPGSGDFAKFTMFDNNL